MTTLLTLALILTGVVALTVYRLRRATTLDREKVSS